MNGTQRNILEKKVPVDSINEEARREKLGKPPISEMHYYFTRKPLIISRFVIAGALLDESKIGRPEDFDRLIGIQSSKKEGAFKSVPLNLIKMIEKEHPEGVTVLDPFGGSGMIPFEALRLGVNVVTLDYNPVATLIMRSTTEYPLKFGNLIDKQTGKSKLYEDVKKYLARVFERTEEELISFYPSHGDRRVKAYVIAWAVECPTCGKITPLVNNWWLDTKEKVRLDYVVRENCIDYSVVKDSNQKEGNMKQGKGACLHCGSTIRNDAIVSDISKNEREVILAVYLDGGIFELPNSDDVNALQLAKRYLNNNSSTLYKFIPSEEMPSDMRALPAKKYLKYWYKLFNPRQLLVLTVFSREIRKVVEELMESDKEYAMAVGCYLSIVLAKHVDYNSRCTHWHSSRKIIGDTLANRGINMMWNHAETNPFKVFWVATQEYSRCS